jgi:uncharacterized protein YecT (DUF1311 family)
LPAAAQPKPGFDCASSGSAVDRLICSDPGLAGQDRELAERYAELGRTVSAQGLAILRSNQRRWLASRSDCVSDRVGKDQRDACMSQRYTERIGELQALYRTADGLSIESRETSRRLPRLRVDESDSYPVLIGPTARVAAFNRAVSQRLDLAKGMFAASGIKLELRPPGDTTFSRHYEIHRFDGTLLSIEIFRFHESYFGHGWRAEFTINWDLRHDRPLRLADIFDKEKDWRQGIYDYAMKDLHEGGDIQDPERWFDRAEVDDDEAWLFNDDGAVVLFGHGERSMVGASAEVAIPYDALEPFLQPAAAAGIVRRQP